jgi:putative acetyltransferase
MNIRRTISADHDALVDIWLRSVQATHFFLSEEDIQSLLPLFRDYLASDKPEFWVICSEAGPLMGFMGMSGRKMESLFLAPEFQGRGGSRRLVRHAQELHGELTTDVNEQNLAACRFYAACGFVSEGRSELDDAGRPFPLLHMRLAASNKPRQATRSE